jgi:hypothetical protein
MPPFFWWMPFGSGSLQRLRINQGDDHEIVIGALGYASLEVAKAQ